MLTGQPVEGRPHGPFVHFPFTDDQAALFIADGAEVTVGFTHPNYAHLAGMPLNVRKPFRRFRLNELPSVVRETRLIKRLF